MKASDFAKAAALGPLLLAINLLIAFAAVFVYAQAVDPGHDRAYYAAAAPGIAGWTAPIGGALLFLLAGWLFAHRRPGRNGVAFIAATFVAYLVVDAAIGAMAGGLEKMFTLRVAVSMGATLLGGVLGAALAARRPAGQASLA